MMLTTRTGIPNYSKVARAGSCSTTLTLNYCSGLASATTIVLHVHCHKQVHCSLGLKLVQTGLNGVHLQGVVSFKIILKLFFRLQQCLYQWQTLFHRDLAVWVWKRASMIWAKFSKLRASFATSSFLRILPRQTPLQTQRSAVKITQAKFQLYFKTCLSPPLLRLLLQYL